MNFIKETTIATAELELRRNYVQEPLCAKLSEDIRNCTGYSEEDFVYNSRNFGLAIETGDLDFYFYKDHCFERDPIDYKIWKRKENEPNNNK